MTTLPTDALQPSDWLAAAARFTLACILAAVLLYLMNFKGGRRAIACSLLVATLISGGLAYLHTHLQRYIWGAIATLVACAAVAELTWLGRSQPAGQTRTKLALGLLGISGLMGIFGFGLLLRHQIAPSYRAAAGAHELGTSMLLAAAMVSALKLTFYDWPDQWQESPQAMRRDWHLLAIVALVSLTLQCAGCFAIIGIPLHQQGELIQGAVAAWMFAATAILVHFIGWIIPMRLLRLDAAARRKEWTTTAISAWTVVVSLTVASLLPVDWPWRIAM